MDRGDAQMTPMGGNKNGQETWEEATSKTAAGIHGISASSPHRMLLAQSAPFACHSQNGEEGFLLRKTTAIVSGAFPEI